jgi:exodeoxyribonuclease VII large subunit
MARRAGRAERDGGTGDLFASPGEREAPPLYTVGQLTTLIGLRLAELGRVRVEGELSQVKRASSGHVFFDIKDEGARLSCKVWQSKARAVLRFELCEGQRLVAWGRLDVYAPQGGYSLIVDRLEQAGLGNLLARLEQTKAELRARGWFDRKRPLPRYPRPIGLVTSRDGAALRDFLRTRSLRWPGYPLRFCHTSVQGPGAAGAIAAAIARLDASGVDAIALVRGGGSLEDLWAFNEEAVAAAIFRASVPVVTGIGHESDTTLADLVADHRAHTPTDAAQTLIPERAKLLGRLERSGNYLVEALDRLLEVRNERLEALRSRAVLRDAEWILGERRRALAAARSRLGATLGEHLAWRRGGLVQLGARLERRSPAAELARRGQRLAGAGLRLGAALERRLARGENALALAARALHGVSPLSVLGRGFSLTRRAGERAPLLSTEGLRAGDEVETQLSRGAFSARVSRLLPAPDEASGQAPDTP